MFANFILFLEFASSDQSKSGHLLRQLWVVGLALQLSVLQIRQLSAWISMMPNHDLAAVEIPGRLKLYVNGF